MHATLNEQGRGGPVHLGGGDLAGITAASGPVPAGVRVAAALAAGVGVVLRRAGSR